MDVNKTLRKIKRVFLLVCAFGVWSAAAQSAEADDFSAWHFYADTIVRPQADDSFEAVYTDFSRLLSRDLKQSGAAFDENSIRVALLENGKTGAAVPFHFTKDVNYNATDNAAGTIVFQVGSTPKAEAVTYRVFFDTQKNGAKAQWKNEVEVPETANMIWNGGFEILSNGYTGPNIYSNPGAKMPRGWWGNFKSVVPNNAATTAHSGEHAIGFVVPEGKTNVGISSAPTPPGVRVVPGQAYLFSLWVKGDGLTSPHPVYGYVYWYDRDQKLLNRVALANLPANTSQFDWTSAEVTLTMPNKAHYSTMTIGTYSTTGLLMVDDFAARISVPAPLTDAKLNQ